MRQLTIPLDDDLYEQFQRFCKQRGEPMTVHIRRYLLQRLEQHQPTFRQDGYPKSQERLYRE